MADMIADVRFAANTWTDLYAFTGISVGTPLIVMNKLLAFDVLLWEGATPPATLVQDGMLLPYARAARTTAGVSGIWAFYPASNTSSQSRLSVQVAT